MHRFGYIACLAFGLSAAGPVLAGPTTAAATATPAAAAPAAAAPAAATPAAAPASAPAAAGGGCPVQGPTMETVAKAINNAANCRAAVGLLKACAFGSSADNALAEAAISKCEARFSRRMSKQRFRAYRDAQRRCDAKYAKMQGTMYQSAAALCRADAALAYARATRRLPR